MNYVNGRFFLASITHHIRSTLKLWGGGGRRTWFRHRPERSFFSCEPESMSTVSVQKLNLPQRRMLFELCSCGHVMPSPVRVGFRYFLQSCSYYVLVHLFCLS